MENYRDPIIHELKTLPIYFYDVKFGKKNFEVRKNDRDFRVGDELLLKEHYDSTYTGNICHRRINYILSDSSFVKEGFVILGISPI